MTVYDAIEKQKPKKVIYGANGYAECGDYGNPAYDIAYCPSCDADLSKYFGNYCPHCGQRLDWGVKQEYDSGTDERKTVQGKG